jgi:hypothetical protein
MFRISEILSERDWSFHVLCLHARVAVERLGGVIHDIARCVNYCVNYKEAFGIFY